MINRYFRVRHRDMVYLKFILEVYEGMNVMSTVDNSAGFSRLAIMSGMGVRPYYRRQGYERAGPYMVKELMVRERS